MHAKLTEIGVKRLQAPEKGRLEVWDRTLPGFGVRVTTSGQKTFMAMYRARGVQRRQTLGSYPAVTLADARKLARKAFAQVAEGRDPSTEKRERREGGKADPFRAVAAEYLERYAKRHKRERSWREDERLIGRELLPRWSARRIGEVSKADVLKLLDATADRAPIMANRLLALVRKLFSWAAERGVIETNPCAGIKAPSKERTRERVLTDDELRKLWPAFETMEYPFGALFKMLLITGQRVSEVAGMRRDELALDDPVPLWTLGSERTKAARQHAVPLPSLAVDLLRGLPELGNYVFTTHGSGNKPVSGFSKAKRRADTLSGVSWNVAILLGADLENASDPDMGWSVIVTSHDRPLGKAQILKVPHHGSSNAHDDQVWSELLVKQPIAIVAPFSRGRTVLPTKSDVHRIYGRAPASFSSARVRFHKPTQRPRTVIRQLREMGVTVRPVNTGFGVVRLRTGPEGRFSIWCVELFDDACPLLEAVA